VTEEKLRVGLLLDSVVAPAWTAALLDNLRTSLEAQICLVVVNTHPLLEKLEGALAAYLALDRRLFPPRPDPEAWRDCNVELAAYHTITAQAHEDHDGLVLDEAALAQIKTANLDVLFHLGFRPLTGEVLSLPKAGVWSLRFGAEFSPDARLCGCWETLGGAKVTCSALVMEQSQHPDYILRQSASATDLFSPAQTRRKVLWKSLAFFTRELHQLKQLGLSNWRQKNVQNALNRDVSYSIQPQVGLTSGLAAVTLRFLSNRLQKALRYTHWQLLYRPGEGFSNQAADYRLIAAPRTAFWSDPFLIVRNDHYYLFFEELSYQKNKGRICVCEMGSTGVMGEVKVALEKPYHLSYPFLFEWQGALFMIPETAANHTIEVHRCMSFPDKWQFEKTLFKDICAVDTTLHFDGKRWWLFTNIREHEGASSWDELFIYYADDPLSSVWTPHPLNPVVSDVRFARPAGQIFEQDGQWIRPSQDSSNGYGWRVHFNKIIELDENDYREEVIDSLTPIPGSGLSGIHTFNRQPGMSVIDGKGWVRR
jgi:hypothetical protein